MAHFRPVRTAALRLVHDSNETCESRCMLAIAKRRTFRAALSSCIPAIADGLPEVHVLDMSTMVMNNAALPALESHKTPLHIGAVTLRARDMAALAGWYEETLSLDRIAAAADRVSLGSGGVPYLHIDAAPDGTLAPDGAAGLFHTAFLLPDRASLGRWFLRTHGLGAAFEGASDHAVSEAFYLSDPEGNGIEVYHDRPRAQWRKEPDGDIFMTTARMDVNAVVAEGRERGVGEGRFPAQARIGHVHLKVGDAAEAEQFYAQALGLEVMARRAPHAVFMASGGYHHHLAVNTWMSRGAGRRPEGALGLAEVAFEATDSRAAIAVEDPWGNRVRVG
jgi:catechol 2,3-dioxygenase